MKQSKFIIRENTAVADHVYRLVLDGDTSEMKRGGQFVDLAIHGFFLRRPIAAQKWDSESMILFYKVVGNGTDVLSRMQAGESLDILTGLGNGFNASACKGKALVVCGGLGASPAFTLVKELLLCGHDVTVVLGFNKYDDMILADEYRLLGAEVHIATLDGSAGTKGFVTDVIASLENDFDYFYTCGPKVMMKAVCNSLDIPGEASLEERMGCGCGICYGCTCHTTKGAKRICADGPVFKKEEIIW
ncbi:MAG: dihydroorotate dehydrogenase electron transfer subunit [Bacteroidales bacterium]|nr:dihydroorotate dehydrogenase electron transfer subunit [Candidatus Cryptobacteroides equifaecalis]